MSDDQARIERLERIVVILADRLAGIGGWTDEELLKITGEIEIRTIDYPNCNNCDNGKKLVVLKVCGVCGRDLKSYREHEEA